MNQKLKLYKNYFIGVILAGGLIAAGILTYATTQKVEEAPANAPATTTQSSTPKTSEQITFTATKGETALSQLKATANVTTKDSSYGPYVDSVNGLKSGTDGKYWSYYIDGKMASVGADAYTAKGGEKIEWKFEKAE